MQALMPEQKALKNKYRRQGRCLATIGILSAITALLAPWAGFVKVGILGLFSYKALRKASWAFHKAAMVGANNPPLFDLPEVKKDPQKMGARIVTALLSAALAYATALLFLFFVTEDVLGVVFISLLVGFTSAEVFGRIFEPDHYKRSVL